MPTRGCQPGYPDANPSLPKTSAGASGRHRQHRNGLNARRQVSVARSAAPTEAIRCVRRGPGRQQPGDTSTVSQPWRRCQGTRNTSREAVGQFCRADPGSFLASAEDCRAYLANMRSGVGATLRAMCSATGPRSRASCHNEPWSDVGRQPVLVILVPTRPCGCCRVVNFAPILSGTYLARLCESRGGA